MGAGEEDFLGAGEEDFLGASVFGAGDEAFFGVAAQYAEGSAEHRALLPADFLEFLFQSETDGKH